MLRVFQDGINRHPLCLIALALQLAIKAAFATRMTGNLTNLFHAEQNNIAVAVQTQVADMLHMAGFLAFAPQALAGTRPVHGTAGADGLLQGLLIHPGDHQDLARGLVLRNRRDQTLFIKADFSQPCR